MFSAILAVIAALTLSNSPAHALTAKCVLRVDGKTYLNGTCPITLDKGGDFTVGSDGTTMAKYWATVSVDKEKGTADGWWNGEEGATHAHDPLGTLTRRGACWANKRAEVCATR